MGDRPTINDYHRAFREGETDPAAVAERTLAVAKRLDEGDGALGAFVGLDANDVLEQADASARRWRAGEILSPLDGVPVAIKDEFDVVGYPTGAGTAFMGARDATSDATVVRRLRQAGAVIFGKTTMTEIGLGGTGINPASKTPRNPWDTDRLTGGSSSGSAAAVAAGIVPAALGSDAGGSIRMPAAICGIYGLKPTYGRIPTSGGALLAWSLDHLGPLAGSLDDVAHFYDAVAGPAADEPESRFQPDPVASLPAEAVAADQLRVCWSPDFADDADPDVRESFHRALELLEEAGVHVEAIRLEHAHFIQRVGYLTIVSEAAASQRDWLREHRGDYNLDTRLLLATGERITAAEYLHTQRIRSLIRREFEDVVATYDTFLNPTLACTAPLVPEEDLKNGVVDSVVNSAVSRYTFAGTLTGLPGLSMPCGKRGGLPVGLHLTGPAFSEARLLAIGRTFDAILPDVGSPATFVDPLSDASSGLS